MHLDYGLLPPEINSGRLHAGPGSASLLAAANAWQTLAAELHTTAAAYDSVTSGLATGAWTGPAATAMAASAVPYVAWLNRTGAQAEQTARQAVRAAEAHATAVAAVVPPPTITANRTSVLQLVVTNFFGQHTPTIGELERQYAEMWAVDAAAMYRYVDSALAASALSPFAPPGQTTNAAGLLAQSAAVAHAAAAGGTHTAGSLASAVSFAGGLAGQVSPFTGLTTQAMSAGMTGWSGTANMLSNINNVIGLLAFTAENPGGLAEVLNPPFLGPAGLGLSASSGTALRIGALSTPPGWAMPATLTSAVAPAGAAAATGATSAAAAAGAGGGLAGAVVGETMLGTLAGRALSAAVGRTAAQRRTVVPRSPAAG